MEKIFFIIFLFIICSFCQTNNIIDPSKDSSSKTIYFDTLVGQLPEIIKSSKRPYLIIGDIEVPINKSVTIEKGVVFLFKNLTGMHVLGTLKVCGTKDEPVIFTSENDRNYNKITSLYPNPYDWNGIYIHKDALGTIFSYCKVLYSVYGIFAETKFIELHGVEFKYNGKSNLMIDGKEQVFSENPFEYALSKTEKDLEISGLKIKDPLARKRNILRYSGLSIAMPTTVIAIYFANQWNSTQHKLKQISVDDPLVLRWHNEEEWISIRKNRDIFFYSTLATGTISVLGYLGIIWSFTF